MTDFLTSISEIADIYDGPHATPKKTGHGPYFLSISSLEKGRLDLSKSAHLSEEDFIKWTKRITPEDGDLLFSYETRLGEAALMPSGVIACLGRRMGLLRPKKDKVIPEYLLYSYLSPQFQQIIVSNTIRGATVDRISLSEMPDFCIRIPDLVEQKKVATLLKVLDMKIELNTRINAELESIAKLLYDYWFVQFDFPDKNANPYKTSGGKLIYNDVFKRQIPEGWRSTQLGELCDLYQPKTISEKEMTPNGKYLVYGANGVVGRYKEYNHEKSVLAITCRGNTCGVINITRPKSWITGNAMVVKPKYDEFCIDFLFNSLMREGISNVITGSAQPQITRTNLAPLMLVEPPLNLVQEYTNRVKAIFETRLKKQEENELLTNLRDWLLPMLMNGQVTVK